jgi:hypothetical protein
MDAPAALQIDAPAARHYRAGGATVPRLRRYDDGGGAFVTSTSANTHYDGW